jgi:diguanylate cyclase (GGDEF)-like protein
VPQTTEIRYANTRVSGDVSVNQAQGYPPDRSGGDPSRDALTGLPSRRLLDEQIENLLKTQTPFELIALDIVSFILYDDWFGHCCGDHLLVKIADIITLFSGHQRQVFRAGGDEFWIVQVGGSHRESECLASQVCAAIAALPIEPFEAMNRTIRSISMSVGLVGFPAQKFSSFEDLKGVVENVICADSLRHRQRDYF